MPGADALPTIPVAAVSWMWAVAWVRQMMRYRRGILKQPNNGYNNEVKKSPRARKTRGIFLVRPAGRSLFPRRQTPDIEHAGACMLVGVAFRKRDLAVDHDGAIPVAA